MSVGQRIKEARLSKGMSQEELALAIEVTQGAIGQFEHDRNQPSLITISRIATELSVSIDWLLEVGNANQDLEKIDNAEDEYFREVDSLFADRIRLAREEAGLNQSELARKMMVTPQAIQKWESSASAPRLSRIYKLAKVLGVPLSYLLPDVPGETPEQLPNLKTITLAERISALPEQKVRALSIILEVII